MSNYEKNRTKIIKKNEMRKKGISKMIDEGGLGAENYYDIEKQKNKNNTDIASKKKE